MNIWILGSGSMIPTRERAHAAVLLEHEKESMLFDCGEGAQRQLRAAGADINRISRIFISHWHGDHVLGLIGLLQTLAVQNYAGTLRIYGPRGSKRYFENMLRSIAFALKITWELRELESGTAAKTDLFRVDCLPMEHSVPCLGWALIEEPKRKISLEAVAKFGIPRGPLLGRLQAGQPVVWKGQTVKPDDVSWLQAGKKFVYITDTIYCSNAVELARDADLLICESTHSAAIEEKAEEYMHLTARQAAQIASQAEVKRLILTHFSQRYKVVDELLAEARAIFPATEAAFDLMKIKL